MGVKCTKPKFRIFDSLSFFSIKYMGPSNYWLIDWCESMSCEQMLFCVTHTYIAAANVVVDVVVYTNCTYYVSVCGLSIPIQIYNGSCCVEYKLCMMVVTSILKIQIVVPKCMLIKIKISWSVTVPPVHSKWVAVFNTLYVKICLNSCIYRLQESSQSL